MKDEPPSQKRAVRSVSSLIAWLSVCMLAAAWGAMLGPGWTTSWKLWGAFGLAAAVGLNVADRLHQANRRRREEDAAMQRLERRLSTVREEELSPR